MADSSPDPSAQTPVLLDIYLALAHISGPTAGPLAPLPSEELEETPRLHVTHTADGRWHVFMRPDLPETTRHLLSTLPASVLFTDHSRVARILAEGDRSVSALNTGLWVGHTLLFPEDIAPLLAHRSLDGLVRLGPERDYYGVSAPDATWLRSALASPEQAPPPREIFPHEQFAALADGVVVATCVSARESALAAEAWVRTIPTARGRGYATHVTAAWALDVRHRGKTPFYSYAQDNRASAGVARALHLIPFLDDVGYL
ncbi:MAG TPA: GNAT family N-acetyltransferase [Ktedonobacterales bacterium]|jgi:hypothetical protein|nr:GNAT family N-acetyltransferase [Ktedonobacterales bacterium]